MSAMGDRLLLLEDTADALDVIDPELARQFRLVNGLPFLGLDDVPGSDPGGLSWTAPAVHVASIEEQPDTIRVTCSCGGWGSEVEWDQIDELVGSARRHFGSAGGALLEERSERGALGGQDSTAIRRVS